MTPYERVMTVLSGGKPDRVPVIPWVRDWCAVQNGFTIKDIMENVEKYVYAQYNSRRVFGYDAVFDLLGICAESEAMGTVIKYDDRTPPIPIEYPIRDYDRDLAKLRIPNPYKDGRLPMILEGVKRLKEICQGEIPVIGYLQGPLRHASMLRNFETVMRDMFKKQTSLQALLDIATDSLIVYGVALVHAGADIIIVSDPTSSGDAISRNQWEKWGIPSTHRLIKSLKRTGIKIILHICGDTNDRMDTFSQFGIDAMSLDENADLEMARRVLGDQFCIFGNVSPSKTLFSGTPEDVERESQKCIEKVGRNGPFILGSGCVVPGSVKPENIMAMVTAALKYGQF